MTATLKQVEPNKYSRILSVGAFRPQNLVPNEELVEAINSSDDWIRQRTGIITRQRADADTSLLDMAEGAAREAIERAGLEPAQVGALIVSTVTFPYFTPSAAAALAGRLGISPSPAYDVSAACAGYCYGIAQADALVRSGLMDYVVVIGVEKLSDIIDNTDRSISFLLGDGAGAVVVGKSDFAGISPSVWGSDGTKWDTISMTHSLLDLRDVAKEAEAHPGQKALVADGAEKLWPTLQQDGPSVFRWAVWEMAKMAKKALEDAGITSADLGAFIPHQANMRIIDEMVKQLKIPENVIVARDIAEAGNTSAASIPLAMHRLLEENPELSGKLALQIGFGAGLVFGAQVVVLP